MYCQCVIKDSACDSLDKPLSYFARREKESSSLAYCNFLHRLILCVDAFDLVVLGGGYVKTVPEILQCSLAWRCESCVFCSPILGSCLGIFTLPNTVILCSVL